MHLERKDMRMQPSTCQPDATTTEQLEHVIWETHKVVMIRLSKYASSLTNNNNDGQIWQFIGLRASF